jgi:hypothetical protein
MAFIADYVLDAALSKLDTEANRLYITSQEATSYVAATSTYALGVKTGLTVSAPTDRVPNGRKVTVAQFSDGTVTGTGTATHYAIVDTVNSRLLATGSLAQPQVVTTGNIFSLADMDIGIADATSV